MIPKIIWQTSAFEYSDQPYYIKVMSETWKELNPEWEYRYVSDEDCKKMILEDYGQHFLDIYNSINFGYVRADFWRYLTLNKHGGVYADIDTYCLQPLNTWIDNTKDMVVSKETFAELGTVIIQWFFATSQNNKYMNSVVDLMMSKINDKSFGFEVTTTHTSPWIFTEGIERCNDMNNILFTQDNFYNNGLELIRHISANSKFSDQHINKKINESMYWNVGNNIDIKMYNKSYNSSMVG